MYVQKKYRCEWVRKNNGIVQVLFKRDEDGQEETMLINVIADAYKFEVGMYYWWQSRSAFPQR
jgi:hypothetical protein